MEPMTIMALLSAGQGIMGGIQKISAGAQRRQAEQDFDKYEIPSGINSMLELLHGSASQTELPGSDIIREQLASSTAEGVGVSQRTAKSSSDVLGALMGLYGKQMDSQQNLALAGAQNYQQNQMRLSQGLQTLGSYQTQKWQYNELYPYMQKMTAAGETDAAGGYNIGSAIGSGINLFGADMQMKHDTSMFDKWKEWQLGKGKASSPLQTNPTTPSVDRYGSDYPAY